MTSGAANDVVRVVTLRVRVWIEMGIQYICLTYIVVTLRVRVWIEMQIGNATVTTI